MPGWHDSVLRVVLKRRANRGHDPEYRIVPPDNPEAAAEARAATTASE